ncbi:MAG: hypothetical protein AAGC68_03485 [Verrucomicrobiota bacterium]
MESVENSDKLPTWAAQLFLGLGIHRGGDPKTILEEAGSMADRLAPNIRRTIRYILLFQGAAVLAPLFWLLVVRHRWEASYVSYAVVISTVIVVGVCWWLRWRGMQHAWTGARMIGEIARSALATIKIKGQQTAEALAGAPTLQPVAEWIGGEVKPEGKSIEEDALQYREYRVDDQLAYYRRKLKEADSERRRLGKIATLSLDGALFLAVAGLAISFNPAAELWLRLSGSDYILGFVGSVLPLVALLMQLLGSSLELDRRTGRYAQQIEFLEVTRKNLKSVESEDELNAIVLEVERMLLGEVVEWYYQTQHSEPYYRSRNRAQEAKEVREAVIRADRTAMERLVSGLGLSASFLGRVVFGRLLVVALSVVVTTGLIALQAPKDPIETSRLRSEDGRLLSHAQAPDWEPIPSRVENGFILIAHGLHDGVDTDDSRRKNGEKHWMTRMQESLESELSSTRPEICLVNWHLAARPSHFSASGLEGSRKGKDEFANPTTPQGWLQNIAAIRPQAENIGEMVGLRIAMAIRNGKLDQTKPMHFIGHSAGGFVVLHAATVLNDLDLAPDDFRVTMLDTPAPVRSHLAHLLEKSEIDYYRTSAFAQGIPESEFLPGFTRYDLKVPEGIDIYMGAHSYAHRWFIDSITEGYENGFRRSPIFRGNGTKEASSPRE